MRAFFGIVVGYALWTVVWLGGNAGLRAWGWLPKDSSVRIDWPSQLLALLFLSVACSFIAGWVGGMVAKASSIYPPLILAFLLLATGVVVQWGMFRLMPLWYHGTFLALVVPVVLFGASIARKA